MKNIKNLLSNKLVALVVAVSVLVLGGLLVSQPAGAIECAILPSSVCGTADQPSTPDTGVMGLLKWVLRILTALVGVAAVAGMIWAGILYTSAGGSMEQVKKAKTIIIDIVIGIIAYALMFLLLNWLIPGGVLS